MSGCRSLVVGYGKGPRVLLGATGVWIQDLPITPEKILNAIRKKREANGPDTPSRGLEARPDLRIQSE